MRNNFIGGTKGKKTEKTDHISEKRVNHAELTRMEMNIVISTISKVIRSDFNFLNKILNPGS